MLEVTHDPSFVAAPLQPLAVALHDEMIEVMRQQRI